MRVLKNAAKEEEARGEMGLKGWNVGVLVAIGAIWFAGTTQREKSVVSDVHKSRVALLEADAAANPGDPARVTALAQAYLDAKQAGMAVTLLDRAPEKVKAEPTVQHLLARALLEQGRSGDALAAERRVLATCTDPSPDVPACSTWLIASATRRADIIEQLVQLGVEDANAHPEVSSIAYHNATRQVTLGVAR